MRSWLTAFLLLVTPALAQATWIVQTLIPDPVPSTLRLKVR